MVKNVIGKISPADSTPACSSLIEKIDAIAAATIPLDINLREIGVR